MQTNAACMILTLEFRNVASLILMLKFRNAVSIIPSPDIWSSKGRLLAFIGWSRHSDVAKTP